MSDSQIGKYEIVREVGRGGMGVVYDARDTQLGRRIALKVLTVSDNLIGEARRQAVERFYREARAAGKISHPNIAQIYDCGEDAGHYYIAMEFCQGTTLRDLIHFERRIPEHRAREIAMQLLSALEAAHAQGVVHRDIKPENIVIGSDNRIKLADFGIAKVLGDSSVTQTGQMLGSPAYMSPEQVMGQNVDARTDLFSAGAVLYECLRGSKAFDGDSITTVTHKIVHDEPEPLAGIAGYWVGILAKALAKDPALRYQCATDMLMDVRAERPPLQTAPPQQLSQTTYSAAPAAQGAYTQPPLPQPPGQWQQPYQGPQPYIMPASSSFAVWGMILGLIGCFPCMTLLGLIGIVLSAVGLSKGESLGKLALGLSITCTALGALVWILLAVVGSYA